MSADKLRFKPEDFRSSKNINMASVKANAWLDAREKEGWQLVNVKDAQVVYGELIDGKFESFDEQEKPNDFDTHRALLINIEELPKKPCKHEPITYTAGYDSDWTKPECKHCGKKLKAKWEAEGE